MCVCVYVRVRVCGRVCGRVSFKGWRAGTLKDEELVLVREWSLACKAKASRV